MALRSLASGGVYICGGIFPKVLSWGEAGARTDCGRDWNTQMHAPRPPSDPHPTPLTLARPPSWIDAI